MADPLVAKRFVAIASPPVVFPGPDGRPHGPNIDLISNAARNAGIEPVWHFASGDPLEELRQGKADFYHALPLAGPPPADLYVTQPWMNSELYIVIREGKNYLAGGLRVAVLDHPVDRAILRKAMPLATVVPQKDREAGLAQLCSAQVDAVVTSPEAAQAFSGSRPPGCQQLRFEWVNPRLTNLASAIAARPASRDSAEAIYTELSKLATSGNVEAFYQPYGLHANRTLNSTVQLGEVEKQLREAAARNQFLGGLSLLLGLALAASLYGLYRTRQAWQRAEAGLKSKTEMLAMVGHELRTPLSALAGISDLLLETRLDHGQRNYIETSKQAALNLNRLMDDLLDVSVLDGAKTPQRQEPFNLETLVADVVQLVRSGTRTTAQQTHLVCDVRLADGRIFVGDWPRLRQALYHLLSNAIRLTPKGTVTLSVVSAKDGGSLVPVRFDITADVSESAVPEIEEQNPPAAKLNLLDLATGARHGEGRDVDEATIDAAKFGLAVTRDLVQLLGGKLELQRLSRTRCLCSLQLRLPHAERPIELEPAERASQTSSQLAKVLVVEDDPATRTMLAKLLPRLGLQADVAANGEQAIVQWQTNPYRAILMDCLMPVLDGFATAERIRSMEAKGTRIPIIAITAEVNEATRMRCLALGMDDFLTKPVDLAQLERVLRRQLVFRDELSCRTGNENR